MKILDGYSTKYRLACHANLGLHKLGSSQCNSYNNCYIPGTSVVNPSKRSSRWLRCQLWSHLKEDSVSTTLIAWDATCHDRLVFPHLGVYQDTVRQHDTSFLTIWTSIASNQLAIVQ